jgi:rhodanese-related sulfurtransferase
LGNRSKATDIETAGERNMFALLMGLKSISPDELHQLIQKQQVTVIDVNSRQSWIKARVPGALNLDPTDYNQSDLPPDKDSSLVFYCSNPMCRKAPNAARRAKKMGYGNVKVMSAGITGWLATELPTEGGE